MTVPSPRSRTSRAASRRLAGLLLLAGLAAVAAIAIGFWLFFGGDAPERVSLQDAQTGLASPTAAAPGQTGDAPGGTNAGPAGSTGAIGGSGTWTVDTTIGSFSDFSSSWVGFRVNEVLEGIGSTEAVGRTASVSGSVRLSGTTIATGRIEVDLTTVRSDRSRRDPAIQRALETGIHPIAIFELTGPIEVRDLLASGGPIDATATGDLTIHGVTRAVEVPVQATMSGGTVVVVGSMPITFSDYGVSMPRAPVVLSVEDAGIIEFQLLLSAG